MWGGVCPGDLDENSHLREDASCHHNAALGFVNSAKAPDHGAGRASQPEIHLNPISTCGYQFTEAECTMGKSVETGAQIVYLGSTCVKGTRGNRLGMEREVKPGETKRLSPVQTALEQVPLVMCLGSRRDG